LYFVLLYLLWSLLYLQLTGKSLATAGASTEPGIGPISVTKGNRTYKLDPLDIICINASGDYVELCTREDSYLKHGTISSYEKALGKGAFVRVHRSVIVNRDQILSVSGPAKGQFWIKLRDGQEIRSSRGYREVVESLTPEAP
jgi:two-component system LytT family response regulator